MFLVLLLLNLVNVVCSTPPSSFYNNQPIFDLTKTIEGWNASNQQIPTNVDSTLRNLLQSNNSQIHLEMEFKRSSFQVLNKLSSVIEKIEQENRSLQSSPKLFITFRYNKDWREVILTSYKYIRSFTFELASDNKLYTCASQNFTYRRLYEHPLKNVSLDSNYWTRAEWGLSLEFSRIFSETPAKKDYIPMGLSVNMKDFPTLENLHCAAEAIKNTRVMEFKLPLYLYLNYGGSYKNFEENINRAMHDADVLFNNVNRTKYWQGYFLYPVLDVYGPLPIDHPTALEYYDSLLRVHLKTWFQKTRFSNFKIIQLPRFDQVSVHEQNKSIDFSGATYKHRLNRYHQMILFLPIHHQKNYSICALRTTIIDLLEDGYDTVGIGFDLLNQMVKVMDQDQLENSTCYVPRLENMMPPPSVDVILDPVSTQNTSINSVLGYIGKALHIKFKVKIIILPLKNRKPKSTKYYKRDDLEAHEWPNATDAFRYLDIKNRNGTYFTERLPENVITLEYISKQFAKENVSVYCTGHEERNFSYLSYATNFDGASQIYNETAEKCLTRQMKNAALEHIIWQLNLDLRQLLSRGTYSFIQYNLRSLQRYLIARQKVTQFDSKIKIDLLLEILDNCEGGDHPNCTATEKKLELYLEPILNWAFAHNFKILLHSSTVPVFVCQYELWQHLEDKKVKDLVFYIPRQFKTLSPIKEIKCIDSNKLLDDSLFNLNHAYSGVSLNFSIKSNEGKTTLTAEEVCALLYFTLGQFSWVYVLVSHKYTLEELTLLYEAIRNPSFPENVLANGIKGRVVTIDIPVAKSVEHNNLLIQTIIQILERFNEINLQADIGLSGWKHVELYVVKNLLLRIRSKGGNLTSVGLCINCYSIAISAWEESKLNSDFKPYTSLLIEADFLICKDVLNVTRQEKQGRYFEKALDGLLFYTNILRMLFLKSLNIRYKMAFNLVDVITEESRLQDGFGYEYKGRLNSNKYTLENLQSISEYARITKMPIYFMPAFQPSKQRDLSSWWIISNYSSLSDISAYEDLRSKYLGTETWKPIIKSKFFYPQKLSTWMLPTFLSISALLIFTMIVLYVKARNRKRRLLSKTEVDEFLNGLKNSEVDDDFNRAPSTFAEKKFLTEYEINKSAIEILESEVLGSGQFGIVYKGVLDDQDTVAIKVPQRDCSKQTFLGMLGEVKLFSYIGSHANVVRFIGAYTNEIRKGTLYVVMEFCNGGSLLSHLEALKPKVDNLIFKQLTRFAGEIAQGMEYIASKNVIHGDLAARNVLLSSDCSCKISDFGLSRKLYEYEEYVKTTDEPLPWRWMAYESLRRLGFSTQSDVWSYGVTLWEVYTLGDVPYTGLAWSADFVDKLESGLRLKKPRFASDDIFETMQKCWEIEPVDRPDFATLVHYFINLSDEHFIRDLSLDSQEVSNVKILDKKDEQVSVFSNNQDLKLLNKPNDDDAKAKQPLLSDYFQWNDFPMTSLNKD